jgi:hypothetical protein
LLPGFGRGPAGSHCDSPRSFRRPALGHTLHNARCADFSNRYPCRVAEELVRSVLADHPRERIISPLAISVAHLRLLGRAAGTSAGLKMKAPARHQRGWRVGRPIRR